MRDLTAQQLVISSGCWCWVVGCWLPPPITNHRSPITTLNSRGYLLLKQRAHRLLGMRETHCLCEQLADGQHRQLVELAVLGNGDRVRDRHFRDRRLLEALSRRT